MTDFLNGRQQRVHVDGAYSDWVPVTSGVPQGSKLGPLLFILYINDLSTQVKRSVVKLFADDCKLYYSTSKQLLDFLPLEDDLSAVGKWAEINQLKLALTKSSVLHIGKNNPERIYKIESDCLPKEKSVRDLGIRIANTLKFTDHYQIISKSAFVISHGMFQCFETKSRHFLLQMFKTYVRPKLDYGAEVWNPV